MKPLAKRLVGLIGLAAVAGAAQAVPVTMTFTGDNWMIGQNNFNDPIALGSVASGGTGSGAADWRVASTTTVDLGAGDYFAHFSVADQGGAGGFIGEIQVDGGPAIQSGTGWEVCTFACDTVIGSWVAATSYGAYGVAPWYTNVDYDFAGAEWIWTADNQADDYAVLRTAFTVVEQTVSDVPEPSIIALFGLGLLGLGFAGRRKV